MTGLCSRAGVAGSKQLKRRCRWPPSQRQANGPQTDSGGNGTETTAARCRHRRVYFRCPALQRQVRNCDDGASFIVETVVVREGGDSHIMSEPTPVTNGVLRGFDLRVSPEAVYRELGYRSSEETPGAVESTFRRVLSQGRRFLSPAVTVRTYPGRRSYNESIPEVPLSSAGCCSRFPLHWPPSIAYFAATLGHHCDAHLCSLNRHGEFLAAMVWDAIGTVAASEVVAALKTRLLNAYGSRGSRMAVSGPHPVTDLPGALSLAQADQLPVVLSRRTSLLSPSKSLVGFFHISLVE